MRLTDQELNQRKKAPRTWSQALTPVSNSRSSVGCLSVVMGRVFGGVASRSFEPSYTSDAIFGDCDENVSGV